MVSELRFVVKPLQGKFLCVCEIRVDGVFFFLARPL